ncbi:MAG: AtpZ/AtpI family protein [Fimbriimonadales bacterium]|nr:AtpZ/AtpI family protein [Fimbriimonadales bacterium]
MPEEPQRPDEPSLQPEAPPSDPMLDELDARLARLQRRAREARAEHEEKKRRGRSSLGDSAHGVGYGLTIAYTILGVPMLGVLVGWLLDQRAGSGQFFTGLGVIVGSVLALVAVAIQISRFEKLR